MSISQNVKIVVFVPKTHCDIVRKAMGDSGAGEIGNYTHCTFSSNGIGCFKPAEGANPFIGQVGKPESVEEERIETICSRNKLKDVVSAIKSVHPYEEIAFDIYPLEDFNQID